MRGQEGGELWDHCASLGQEGPKQLLGEVGLALALKT